ncbi:hypothetical protein [Roseovarius nitratireducens]|uniref:hypothetical protein n=1 Tax=Roseovarius nitratireducens TaxID=2044597 RepID=UPI000CE23E75|nr:hypothetical protein [Roseovarius nitratireducens]
MSPQGLMQKIMEAGANVEVCAIYLPGANAGPEALISLYRTALDGGKSLCLCVSFSTSKESLPADAITRISRFRAMMINWLAGVFELGKTDGSIKAVLGTDAEAAAALPLLEGAQLAARAEENPAPYDAAVRLLLDRCA